MLNWLARARRCPVWAVQGSVDDYCMVNWADSPTALAATHVSLTLQGALPQKNSLRRKAMASAVPNSRITWPVLAWKPTIAGESWCYGCTSTPCG